MSRIVVRGARPADLPSLPAIETSAVEAYAGYGQPLEDYEAPPDDYWAPHLRAGLLWVAEDTAAGPVGFAAAERQDGGLYVAEVDVVITHQRRGIGRRLMNAVIDQARRERLGNLTLTTRHDIPWNAPFYRSLGFVVLSEDSLPPHLSATRARESRLPNRCAMRLLI